jgi:hypothetical protein
MAGGTDDLVNIREAARQCGRNMETVRRWVWGGKLPAQKLGNQLFIRKRDLASFCRETATVAYRADLEPEKDTGKAQLFKTEIEDVLYKSSEEYMAGTNITEKEDFLEGALLLRKKLRERGYPGLDAAALVEKSREGRTRELRQGLH